MPERDPLDYFQDREEAIESFDRLWEDGQRQWILAFDGFSGLGKSTLIEWLIVNRCEANQIPHSYVDFETPREYKDLLGGILRHVGLRAHIPPAAYQHFEEQRDLILEDRAQQRDAINIDQSQSDGQSNVQEVNLNLAESRRKIDLEARDRLTEARLSCLGTMGDPQLAIFLDTFENFQGNAAGSGQYPPCAGPGTSRQVRMGRGPETL